MAKKFRGSRRLKREIDSWSEEGLLTEEQAKKLYARYDLHLPEPWYRKTGFIISSLALLFVAIGILLIVIENWYRISFPNRIAIIIFPLISSWLIGLTYLHKEKKEEAELTFFFSNLAFGANIFLLSNLFHTNYYFPSGLLWWILGVIPFAIYFQSNIHHFIIQILCLAWFSCQLYFHHYSFWSPVIMGVIAWLLYSKPNVFMLILAIVNTYLFFINLETLFLKTETEFIILVSTISLFLIIALHWLRHQYSEKLIERIDASAGFLIIFTLYLFTFQAIIDAVLENELSYLTISLFLISMALYIIQPKQTYTSLEVLIVALLILEYLSANYFLEKVFPAYPNFLVVINNSLIIGLILFLLAYGLKKKQKQVFIVGVCFLLFVFTSRFFYL
ncbi:DUF2157 domain-containing protein, partial [Xanthovirga aplysinae]|uniref:DUF2157 domain-containing protein n=1 Tax=Xanthovirga aplysinae TaxID=2529853 RepID=UPI0012BBC017